MDFDKITRVSMLYDFYGQLLTERQQEVMGLYYEENLSLSEIAEDFSISRQGVHDSLKNAEKALYDYEDKLGLVKKFENSKRVIRDVEKAIDKIMKENKKNPLLSRGLEDMKAIIDNLDQ